MPHFFVTVTLDDIVRLVVTVLGLLGWAVFILLILWAAHGKRRDK